MLTRRQVAIGGLALGLAGRGAAQQGPEPGWQWAVLAGTTSEAEAALEAIRAGGRTDLIAGLVEAMRFSRERTGAISQTLAALTGERRAHDWFDWMLWQQAHPEIVPHDSYIGFKREIYLRIDPNFDVFLKPAFLRRDAMKIRLEEITWGGVLKDAIPALDNPAMIGAAQADYLRPDDLVFGVSINGDARAYPLRIMGWHEMFNEVIGGVAVALAYCTLCGAGILFETEVEGRANPFVFGSSGFLYRSNKLMFDRQTHSLWNQFTGRPVVGPLADSGIELRQRPVVITGWTSWRTANPDTTVLSLDTGYRRDYGSGVVYRDYFASDELMFPALSDQTRQKQKDYVFGIRRFAGAKAWPVEAFRRRPVINDSVAGFDVVLLGDADSRTVRAYAREGLTFRAAGGQILSEDGAAWTVGEEALTSADGRSLARQAGHVAYWFAWDGYLGARSELYEE
jgi:hypothetical protein